MMSFKPIPLMSLGLVGRGGGGGKKRAMMELDHSPECLYALATTKKPIVRYHWTALEVVILLKRYFLC